MKKDKKKINQWIGNIITLAAVILLISLIPGVLKRDQAVADVHEQYKDLIHNLTCDQLLRIQNGGYTPYVGTQAESFYVVIYNESENNNPDSSGAREEE